MKNKTYTAYGKYDVAPNGLAQKGESMWNPSTNSVLYIDKGTEGVDDKPVNVLDETFIPSNALGFDKILEPHAKKISNIQNKQRMIEKSAALSSLSKLTKLVQDREVGKYIDKTIRPVAELQAALTGGSQNTLKFPKFDKGFIGRQLPTIAGLTASLGQLLHWSKNKPSKSNTFASNPYETRALSDLQRLNYSPYADIQASSDAERRAAYANSQAGGMLGSQRYAGRIGLGLASMRNAANVIGNAQLQNNKLDELKAKTALEVGNQRATRNQNATQFDYNTYSAAHGAKTKGIERSVANALSAIYNGYSNEFKHNTWQDTADLYRQLIDNDKKALLANFLESRPIYTEARPAYTMYTPNVWWPYNWRNGLNKKYTLTPNMSIS